MRLLSALFCASLAQCRADCDAATATANVGNETCVICPVPGACCRPEVFPDECIVAIKSYVENAEGQCCPEQCKFGAPNGTAACKPVGAMCSSESTVESGKLCAVPGCVAPPKGCLPVKKLVVTSSNACCPKPCYSEKDGVDCNKDNGDGAPSLGLPGVAMVFAAAQLVSALSR